MSVSNGDCDAVFCCNDDLALGALFECQRMNVQVPDDIALCGFNDVEAAALVNPPLSSVHVPRYQMGVTAAQMVLNRLQGKEDAERIVTSEYTLKMRASTGWK